MVECESVSSRAKKRGKEIKITAILCPLTPHDRIVGTCPALTAMRCSVARSRGRGGVRRRTRFLKILERDGSATPCLAFDSHDRLRIARGARRNRAFEVIVPVRSPLFLVFLADKFLDSLGEKRILSFLAVFFQLFSFQGNVIFTSLRQWF
jgi:hypothetical protein